MAKYRIEKRWCFGSDCYLYYPQERFLFKWGDLDLNGHFYSPRFKSSKKMWTNRECAAVEFIDRLRLRDSKSDSVVWES